ncbi:hydroxymethylglutaryl-CoA synthase [Microbacterium sp. NPDC089189]|uniref:hydroxymethylglutaryl-CoA synthase n=1 Tax=Microbacterium sp. NPDC089189 TaxID=3154972 RepID=UPI00343A38D5
MTSPTRIGIHDLAVATAGHVLDLDDLAAATGVDPGKFHIGLGQDQMSVPGPDEDIVTMGATAAQQIIARHGVDRIRTVFFATESGVDQSKSAGVWLHELLGLPSTSRVVELKQACYSATAALQAAAGLVARETDTQVLVVASDIARYDLDSAAEPTQGAGAVALLVSADPALAELEPVAGLHTAHVDDFWRPNDSVTAVVDGKLSIDAYLDGFVAAWDDYRTRGGVDIDEIDLFTHHQPFTRMAAKAHRRLAEHTGAELPAERYERSTVYNRRIGNSYTASLYLGLAALLDGDDDLTGRRIGLFSYGSGSVSEFFTVVVQPGYRDHTRASETAAALAARTPMDVAAYRALHAGAHLGSRVDVEIPAQSPWPFHFAGVSGRARQYSA